VIGHFCSYPSLAAAKLYEKAGITMISPSASVAALTTSGLSNVIRLAPRDDMQGTFAARRILQKRAGAKVAVLQDGTVTNALIVKAFIEAYGKEPDFKARIEPDAKDYGQLLASIKSQNVSTIYFAASASDAGHIVAQASASGLALKYYGTDALLGDQFWEAANAAGENAMASFPSDPQKQSAARTAIAALKVSGQTADGATLPAYAAVQLYVAAAKAKGAHSGAGIAAWLKQGQEIETVAGTLAFAANGDSKALNFTWFAWREGAYQAIVPQN